MQIDKCKTLGCSIKKRIIERHEIRKSKIQGEINYLERLLEELNYIGCINFHDKIYYRYTDYEFVKKKIDKEIKKHREEIRYINQIIREYIKEDEEKIENKLFLGLPTNQKPRKSTS